ncbi:SDR family oxidoreductase [Arenimonas sp.]|uniref:SDR family NAD(P)-dependent oxidoreductase n=1 Tax=Arenimonas sp. TaxID=1872635 RepID=UPI002E351C46|nr:SDR family oxidoreductase [Arenimonas sp.]HEX4853629.1 SDR family oxidoreductase [Arenimonas sp.]
MNTYPRAIFITGGGTGLGAATARHLVAGGWRVALAGRREKLLHDLAAELGAAAQVYALDVADAAAVERAVRDYRPDGLVCAAAILGRGDPYGELTAARFAEVMAINVNGSFHACSAAMRLWREGGVAGDIVNVASLGGIRGLQRFPGFGAYATSKHAIVGMTEALALDGKAHGIRVNAVAPGTLRTPMVEALGLVPRTTPDAIAPTIEFLLDRRRSGPISGTIVEIHCNDD